MKEINRPHATRASRHASIIPAHLALIALVALAALPLAAPHANAQFATRVVDYNPGTGFAVEFDTGNGYTNRSAILGEPARETPGLFGGPVTPFAPPYLASQLLSIGSHGSVTLEFDPPIRNHPWNPFGIDFLVFNGAGFVITNGDYSGGGITDGSLFATSPSTTRVAVSADGVNFYTLDTNIAPAVEGLLPTDPRGSATTPAHPALRPADLAGLGLDAIRTRYGNSAGGVGFNLDWARTSNGQKIQLDAARFVRIDVLDGRVELDALSAVAPEPPSTSRAIAGSWEEHFDSNPWTRGWRTVGEPTLFQWDPGTQRLETTWDSAKPNAWFLKPLGRPLSDADDFSVQLDLELRDIQIGLTKERPFTFQLAFGWLNAADATRHDFRRGSGTGVTNVVEWNYFPDSGFGPTISPVALSQNADWSWQPMTIGVALVPGKRYGIQFAYSAAARSLQSNLLVDGQPGPPIQAVPIPSTSAGFSVDAFAIASYNDDSADGSILAHGWIDNLTLNLPAHPIGNLTLQSSDAGRGWSFHSVKGWKYQLQTSTDLIHWSPVSSPFQGTGAPMTVAGERNPALPHAFYRVQGERP